MRSARERVERMFFSSSTTSTLAFGMAAALWHGPRRRQSARSGADHHLEERQDDLEDDQQDDVPLHPQRPVVLQNLEQRGGVLGQEGYFATEGVVPLAQLVRLREAAPEAIEVGPIPHRVG